MGVRRGTGGGPVGEGHEPGVQHARRWGVGRLLTTDEVLEQRRATAGGGYGGKATGQGEHRAGDRARTQSRISEWSDLLGVRKAARKDKRTRFTALLHHVTVDLLRASFYALKREAAPGIDGVTWKEYETNLDEKLADLHSRIHRGTYRAQPSKRTYIPKADGRQRPLGIAALEDKVAQQAVVTVLNQIYEEDFVGFSYGFRPGRSQHQAPIYQAWTRCGWGSCGRR